MSHEMRNLTAEELDAVAGSLHFDIANHVLHVSLSVTGDGITIGVKVGDGDWHGGTIWF